MILWFRRLVCKVVGHHYAVRYKYNPLEIDEGAYESFIYESAWFKCSRCGWEHN